MIQPVGISGSLRKGSFNTALLRAAASLVPDGFVIEVQTLHGIPLYDGDDEAAGRFPPAASDLKETVARAAGLIFVTPEYNNSIPGVFKNAVDWLSRPPADIKGVFGASHWLSSAPRQRTSAPSSPRPPGYRSFARSA